MHSANSEGENANPTWLSLAQTALGFPPEDAPKTSGFPWVFKDVAVCLEVTLFEVGLKGNQRGTAEFLGF